MHNGKIELLGQPFEFEWTCTLLARAEERDLHTDLYLVRIIEKETSDDFEAEVTMPISLRYPNGELKEPELDDILLELSIQAKNGNPDAAAWFTKIDVDPVALFDYYDNLYQTEMLQS